MFKKIAVNFSAVIISSVMTVAPAMATHSWGSYHWARTSNPFTLKLGDNLTSNWDTYLATTSSDWSASTVLDTTIVAGSTTPRQCKPKAGQVEICNAKYGFNGWLGIASVWTNGSHITQGTVKMNDSYFNTASYNTPAWRNLVMCQEVGHTLGLDHQDENHSNSNLGTCMDYTSNPEPNQHPNAHDYEMLESLYAHTDTTTTVAQTPNASAAAQSGEPGSWGRLVKTQGRTAIYELNLGNNQKVFTFVFHS